jgi:hypothetical protein
MKSTKTRKLVAFATVVAAMTIVSGFLGAGGHRMTAHVTTPPIDPTLITLRAGPLPVVQVDEPF